MQRPASSSSSSDQSDTISHTSILAFQLPPVATSLNEGPDGTFIRERLAGFNKMLRQLHLATNKSNDSMQKLSKLQKRITSDTAEDTPANRDRLNTLYRSSVKDTETEAELTRQAMDTIFDIRALMKQRQKKLMYNMNSQNQIRRGQLMKILSDCANTLPLYIGKHVRRLDYAISQFTFGSFTIRSINNGEATTTCGCNSRREWTHCQDW